MWSVQSSQIQKEEDGSVVSLVLGSEKAGGWERMGSRCWGAQGSFLGQWKCPRVDGGDGYKLYKYAKNCKLYNLNRWNVLCVNYISIKLLNYKT